MSKGSGDRTTNHRARRANHDRIFCRHQWKPGPSGPVTMILVCDLCGKRKEERTVTYRGTDRINKKAKGRAKR